jgi:serine protease Do
MSLDTGLTGVVVVEVKANSRALRLRVRPGDFIVAVNDDATPNVAALRKAAVKTAAGWRITVRRGDRVITATING